MSKKTEAGKRREEAETAASARQREIAELYPVGSIVRYNEKHGWYHARVKQIDKLAAIVVDLSGGNSKRVEFDSLDKPMFGGSDD